MKYLEFFAFFLLPLKIDTSQVGKRHFQLFTQELLISDDRHAIEIICT